MFVLMNYPVGSASSLQRLCWKRSCRPMAAWNRLGAVVGAALYRLSCCSSLT
jgi:hypothetical protein